MNDLPRVATRIAAAGRRIRDPLITIPASVPLCHRANPVIISIRDYILWDQMAGPSTGVCIVELRMYIDTALYTDLA